jgi:chaperone BCS1
VVAFVAASAPPFIRQGLSATRLASCTASIFLLISTFDSANIFHRGYGQGQMSATTTFPPGLGTKTTIMDLAVSALIPEGVPNTLTPLVKLIYGFVLKKARIDITATISKIAIAAGAIYSLKAVWDFAKPFILSTLTTSITFPVEHQTAKDIQAWLIAYGNFGGAGKRHIKYTATGMVYNKTTQKFQVEGDKQTNIDGGWFFFKKQPLYFVHTKITGNAKVSEYIESNEYGSKQLSGDEISIFALGSTGILENLVKAVSVDQIAVKGTTVVFHITEANDDAAYRGGGFQEWNPRARPARPMSTIDLCADLKEDLLDDIMQFLEPSRQKFYSYRGIPYSRKVLIFGPPGTGKSSFAFALAGMTQGALYQANIGEIRDEVHMRRLFRYPEKGDILLLEDIDCASIGREKVSDGDDEKKKKRRKSKKRLRKSKPVSISLSGLLNAIDAIPDGVILLMTSNSPESLDKALVRPGRIDKQVLFGYIEKSVAETIFKRMYQNSNDEPNDPEVTALAMQFSAKIPDLKLTPAEVQGFLIPRADPKIAVMEADKWIQDVLVARKKGLNIVGAKGDDTALGLMKSRRRPNKTNGMRKINSGKQDTCGSDELVLEYFDALEQINCDVVVSKIHSDDGSRGGYSSDTLTEDGSTSDSESSTDSGSESDHSSDSGSEDDSSSGSASGSETDHD